jgi:hypothetical protein
MKRKQQKISDETIIAIHRDNRSTKNIAEAYNVHPTIVLAIKRGNYRKDLHLGPTAKKRKEYTRKLLGPKPQDNKFNFRLWRVQSDRTTWHLPERPQ